MYNIILASTSPRRKEILNNFEIPFKVKGSEIEEKMDDREMPEQIAMSLAFQKAIDVANKCNYEDIIIAADTIVVKDEVLGKPKNYEDAFKMLKALQNNIHFVITGFSIIQLSTNKKIVCYEKTKVKMKALDDEMIKKYINTGEVWDKAGAYAVQGKGAAIVEWIEGDYFNVVGLPISKLQNNLKKYFDIDLF
ncbi:septum formation protein Maf [Lutibacter sp. B2]|nr:septum formation protein Maf [Lutibacter sp. B2]